MNSTPMWCKMLRKALWNFKVKMQSAWIQHDFDMNSTPASPQPNLHQNLGKNLQFNTKSQNHWKCMNSAWIWHEWQYNVTRLNMHEFSMNSAWIQHEFSMNLTPCCSPNIYWNCQNFPDFLRRFGLAVWIWSQKKCFLTYFREMHESSMNPAWMDFSNILTPPTPNHQSKPPIQTTTQTNLVRLFLTFFSKKKNVESESCRFHAEFMHIQTCNIIFPFMSDSCQIHAEFMYFQWFWDLVLNWRFFPRFWCKFGWGEAGIEFMSNSCWLHFYLEVSQRFAQHFASHWCWIHVEFMLNSCWIQAKPWKIPKFANKAAFKAFNWIIHAIYY